MSPASLIAFENRIRDHFAAGDLPCLIHLSGGNEEQLLELFQRVGPRDWVLSTHRSHYHALLRGIPAEHLEAEILAGRSMFLFSAEHRFLTSSVLAGMCPIAAGLAWEIKQRGGDELVWCFLGDGAEENGGFYEAALFAEAHGLPVRFVIEDNMRQVDTPKTARRAGAAWQPLDHFGCVERYYYTPTYPHGGAGLPPGSVTFRPEAIARLRPAA